MSQPFSQSELPQPPYQTTRLVIRPFEDSDAELAHSALDQDPEVWRFDPGYERTLAERRAIIARFAMLQHQFGFAPMAAFARDDGALVGQGGLNPYIYDQRDGTRTVEFEVMFKVARPCWRQGYAVEIARFWSGFAFRELQLARLLVCPLRKNEGSIAVLKSVGATFEDDWLDPDSVIAKITTAA